MSDEKCGCYASIKDEERHPRIHWCTLHAAAPKLLEACEAASEWAAKYPLQGPSSAADTRAAACVYNKTTAAISAAAKEGR